MADNTDKIVISASFRRMSYTLFLYTFAAGGAWFAHKFSDPDFVLKTRFAFIFNIFPNWLVSGFFVLFSAFFIFCSLRLTWMKVFRVPLYQFDDDGIETLRGFAKRRLRWDDVTEIEAATPRLLGINWVDARNIRDPMAARSSYRLCFVDRDGSTGHMLVSVAVGISNEELRGLLNRFRPDLVPAPPAKPARAPEAPQREIVVSSHSWTG